jgi:argininosuccinate lyase
VEEVNKLFVNGMPFCDAYKEVGNTINSGNFSPERKVAHTHEGSIGNLCHAEIRAMMMKIFKTKR